MSDIFFSITPLEELSREIQTPSNPERSKYNEIYFVNKGCVVREMNLRPIQINPGELHLSLEKQIVSLKAFGEQAEGFCCRFSNELLEQLYLKDNIAKDLVFINSFMFRYPLRLDKRAARRLSRTFSTLYDLRRNSASSRDLITGYLLTVLLELKEILQPIEQGSLSSRPFLIAKQYHDLLAKHITSHRDIGFYASKLGVSPNHLNKSLKMATGETAIELRNRTTLLEAKLLLKESHLTINEIAARLGFCEQSYFSRFFKKATGLSPLQYREH